MAQSVPVSPSAPATHINFINEPIIRPNFTGTGDESIHNFMDRINDECTRRNAFSDQKRLSILKSRISFEDNSTTGLLVRSDKSTSITTYNEFTSELIKHFQSHSTLGTTHSILKMTSSTLQNGYSFSNALHAKNFATTLSSEVVSQLKTSVWLENSSLSEEALQKLLAYMCFISVIDDKKKFKCL